MRIETAYCLRPVLRTAPLFIPIDLSIGRSFATWTRSPQ